MIWGSTWLFIKMDEKLSWAVAVGGFAILLGMALTIWEQTAIWKRLHPGIEGARSEP